MFFKKYKLGFDIWGLLLFLIVMIPNFVWFAVPAPNDVLRIESVTETVDTIGSICQVLMIIAITFFLYMAKNRNAKHGKIVNPIMTTGFAAPL